MKNSNDVVTCVYTHDPSALLPYIVHSVYTNNGLSATPLYLSCPAYGTLQGLYNTILSICASNNVRVHRWTDFGTTWYNVQFIDIAEPSKVNIFARRYAKKSVTA